MYMWSAGFAARPVLMLGQMGGYCVVYGLTVPKPYLLTTNLLCGVTRNRTGGHNFCLMHTNIFILVNLNAQKYKKIRIIPSGDPGG